MVVTRLLGGIGNQMFQYAAGRNLSYILNTDLKLDISCYEKYKLRQYELGVFNIQEKFATAEEIMEIKFEKQNFTKKISQKLLKKFFAIPPKMPRTLPSYIKEKKLFHFQPEILDLKGNIYLEGSWQSEKYFKDIRKIIIQDFTPIKKFKGKNKELEEKISQSLSVSIHIRRGDYVTNPRTSEFHGLCNLEYYKRCISIIKEKFLEPHFFIFSDDMDWVRESFILEEPAFYINHNGIENAWKDIRLMSMCKHHIIANSSFSWWGAWLGERQDKLIFSPKKWLNKSEVTVKDLIPNSWSKI